MIEGFEDIESLARMNYLIDVARGNMSSIGWAKLDEDTKKLYIEEAIKCEYVITSMDLNYLERMMTLDSRTFDYTRR